ncbi:hypothetical protein CTI14_71125, partial [Methylobacterium radiotolerans]
GFQAADSSRQHALDMQAGEAARGGTFGVQSKRLMGVASSGFQAADSSRQHALDMQAGEAARGGTFGVQSKR